MEKTDKTIRQRLLKYVLTALTLATIILMVVLGSISIGFLLRLTNDLQDTETSEVQQSVATWYGERMAELRTIHDTVETFHMTSDPDFKPAEYLASMLAQNEDKGIFDYYIGMEDTTCYFGGGWEPAPGEYDPTTRDWYKAAKSTDGIYVSEAYVDAETGRVVITISIALHENGKVVGVLAADVFTDDLQSIASSYFDANDSKYVVLIDSAGTVMAHKNSAFLPTVSADGTEKLINYKEAKIPEQVVGSARPVKKIASDYKGPFRVFTGVNVDIAGVSIVVVDTGLHYYGGVLIFFACCIGLLLVMILVCRKITRRFIDPLLDPLGELISAADKMSRGELEYTSEYKTEDEIGTLCKAIEHSNSSIREYINDVENKLSALADGDLTANVEMDYIGDFEELKSSINSISSSLNSTMRIILEAADAVHGKASDVAKEAGELKNSVQGVHNRLEDANDQIKEVKTRFDENLDQTNESRLVSENMTRALNDSYAKLDDLNVAMEKIREKSNSIAEIIGIINNIASQTNMLALNASIEAARAGEHGKGFAVVADSVRELAEQTTKAVADSEALIRESVEAVNEGHELVEVAVNEMKAAVKETDNVNTCISNIADSIHEETAIIESVAESISDIDSFARDTENTSAECVEMTQGLYSEVDKMHEIVGRFKI